MIFQASAVGSIALDLLNKHNHMRVHSIFNNGFNIVNDSNDLIFVGTNKNGYFPFGITIDKNTMHYAKEYLSVGDTVKNNRRGIDHKDFMIVLNQADIVKYEKVQPQAVDVDALTAVVNEFNFDKYTDSDFYPVKIREILDALNDETKPFPLKYLVGRGSGLTPSGDDMITGILYVDALSPFVSEKHKKTLSNYLNETVTTIVSENFIKLALNGIFSSKITDLGKEVSKEAVEELLALGSSSGHDTLYGIYQTLNWR